MTQTQRNRNALRTAALMECIALHRNGLPLTADAARQLFLAVGGSPRWWQEGGEFWTAGGAVVTFTRTDMGYAVSVTASRI